MAKLVDVGSIATHFESLEYQGGFKSVPLA